MKKIMLILILLFGASGLLKAHENSLPEDISSLSLQQLSESVYILQGPQAFPSPETAGFMNNPGVVLTPGGVVVIDPGSSVQIGRLLLEKIREVTSDNLIAVFNTHVHGDHWLGNQALLEVHPGIPVYAHEEMIRRVEAGEGEDWIANFNLATGGATAGTVVVKPNVGLVGGERIELGGSEFQVYHTGKAHTDHDIMLKFAQEKILFLGDIVTSKRVQSARPEDSDIKGQIAAIEFVLTLDGDVYVPGHGQAGGQEMVLEHLEFLQDLYASVDKHFAKGLNDYEMKPGVEKDLVAYSEWQNFDELGRVISHVYLQVEENSF